MKDTELMWIVGIIEGEGYIGYEQDNGPTLVVNMTDEDVVRRLSELLECPKAVREIDTKKYTGNTNHKPHWRFRVSGPRARNLMRIIYPHMGYRRSNKIKDVLMKWKDRPNKHRARDESNG